MAKRSRGSTRPGQRRPTQRQRPASPRPQPTTLAAPANPPSTLTEAEEERAAEIEAGIVEQERAADSARRRGRERSQAASEPDLATRGRPRGSLAVRYADEYAYVRRDLRQIALLAVVLVSILVALWLLIDVAGVIKI
jgi:hypothetical protein